jgi:hypothetical protein
MRSCARGSGPVLRAAATLRPPVGAEACDGAASRRALISASFGFAAR